MRVEGAPLRRRLLSAIVAVTALVVALFAIPLAVAINQLYQDETVAALQRDATWIAAAIPDDVGRDPRLPLALPQDISADLTVGVYTVKGARLFGAGPSTSAFAAASRDGHTHDRAGDGFVAVAAPIPSDEGIRLTVRVATPLDVVQDRVHRAWLLMAVLALVAIVLGAGIAIYLSARLAAPLERLTAAAQALGAGDFSIRPPHSGLREADQAGQALETTARRLGEVLSRERAFSADVSHQLRTGLTGLLLGLESALARSDGDQTASLRTALARGERLHTIIDDLVRLSRHSDAAGESLDLPALAEQVRHDWHGPLAEQGRRLTITIEPGLPPAAASPAAVRQILRVLLDNATVHGRGEVTLTISDVGPGLAIVVGDQGEGVTEGEDVFARSSGEGHGIGLALARSLAEAEDGRLVLRRHAPPLFSLLLSYTS
ncbi:sensor histidine kinase [Sphaerisporangium perillae]|uniref:sensor histidine kinase n=1 Tax=Sphaerisporangium perillae TaxID=2935860 RepID=UPI00200F47CC|nr:HAMP domain-containing sensor histidine kinase [Sphaerisporangium perillae]